MIIVPELQTVVILTPRTGTGALRRAIVDAYPEAMLIYRHMEADGVPLGYDHWHRVGVVRHPVDRLWSLYKFLRTFGDTEHQRRHDPAYIQSLRRCAERPFSEWIVENQTVFTAPYDTAGKGRFFPHYTVRHPLPENRKSQHVYLRPDLGTIVHQYSAIGELFAELGVDPIQYNQTSDEAPPPLSAEAEDHMSRFFEWDFAVTVGCTLTRAA